MLGKDKKLAESLRAKEEESIHFSQHGSIQEFSLNQLRNHVKQVMIPLLIRTFRYHLEVLPPYQEVDSSKKESFDKVVAELRVLNEDLQNLQQWISSCRSQIEKAFIEPEEHKSHSTQIGIATNPAISQFFQDAMESARGEKEIPSLLTEAPIAKPPISWWKRFFSFRIR